MSLGIDQSKPSSTSGSKTPWFIRIRHVYEYGVVRAGVAIARALPLEFGARLSGWVWSVVARRLSRHRRADRHLAAMWPELSPAERQRILLSMWRHLGATFIEGFQIDRIAAEPDRIELDEACRAILLRTVNEGGIVACVHLGNWEAATAPLAAAGARHLGVYRRVGNPLIDAYVRRLRAPYFTSGLVAKGHAAARGLLRQARQGGSIGMMADLREIEGVAAPFFGRPAPSTPAPATLARQFGRPLFAVALVRVGASRFKMQAVEIEVRHSDDRAGDVRDATAAIQSAFEGWIRRWPDQWMWAHRRYDAKGR